VRLHLQPSTRISQLGGGVDLETRWCGSGVDAVDARVEGRHRIGRRPPASKPMCSRRAVVDRWGWEGWRVGEAAHPRWSP
jgi:hypothetical protein